MRMALDEQLHLKYQASYPKSASEILNQIFFFPSSQDKTNHKLSFPKIKSFLETQVNEPIKESQRAIQYLPSHHSIEYIHYVDWLPYKFFRQSQSKATF